MAVKNDFSFEFACLVKQLQASPDNPQLKQNVISKIPEMIRLAKVNPLAQYRLALLHPPASAPYKQMMEISAQMGCTNAMLALCDVLLKSKNHSAIDLEKAAHYLKKIENSKDTFIIEQSQSLLRSKPELELLMKKENQEFYSPNYSFFNGKEEVGEQLDPQLKTQPKL